MHARCYAANSVSSDRQYSAKAASYSNARCLSLEVHHRALLGRLAVEPREPSQFQAPMVPCIALQDDTLRLEIGPSCMHACLTQCC